MEEPRSTSSVAALLRQLIEDDGDLIGLATVVTGPQASEDPAPEARRLMTLGVSWDWVALEFHSHRFWDLHVGVLPSTELPGRFHVGLHWATSVDQACRQWAQALLPRSELALSVVAQEHQLVLSDVAGRCEFDMRSAAQAAKRVALVALRPGPPSSSPPQRRPRS